VRAAAIFLGVSPQTVYLWVERKQIPHLRVMGRNIRFLKSDFEPFRALNSDRRLGMARPSKHNTGLYEREESRLWWMRYRDKDGKVLSAGGVADEWVTQLLRQGDAKVFKKYSQMKLQMKREALAKLKRRANEGGLSFGTAQPDHVGLAQVRTQLRQWDAKTVEQERTTLLESTEVWSGRGDLNARPPAPKSVAAAF